MENHSPLFAHSQEIAEWIRDALGIGREWRPKRVLVACAIVFLLSFAMKSLHQVDLAYVTHTREQPAAGMSRRYDTEATEIASGRAILYPKIQDPSDTGLLIRPPGYAVFLSVLYKAFGRSYFTVQFVQNLLLSFCPVLIVLIAGKLIGWRGGVMGGLLSSVWHQFSYYSNVILPDALCALPLLVAALLLLMAEERKNASFWLTCGAGVLIGITAWLRPEALLIGIFLAVLLAARSLCRIEHLTPRLLALGLAPFLVVSPITIRNFVIYHDFVPISIGGGITLWEAVCEASGGQIGDGVDDRQVAAKEAVLYNNPRYAERWASPDGIRRDRDRSKKALAVIAKRPFWYSGVMLRRMGEILTYSRFISRTYVNTFPAMLEPARRITGTAKEQPALEAAGIASWSLSIGRPLSRLRPIGRFFERMVKDTSLAFIVVGAVVLFWIDWRKALFIAMIPLYYLMVLSTMETEYRYTLPIHYFLFVFGAAAWVLLASLIGSALAKSAAFITFALTEQK